MEVRTRSRSRSSTTSEFLNHIDDKAQCDKRKRPKQKLVSLYRLLVLELNLPRNESEKSASPEVQGQMSNAQERLTNMVKVPFYLEKFICFGIVVCANAFLTMFTLVPLKIAIVSYNAFCEFLRSSNRDGKTSTMMRRIHFVKRDVITLILIVSSVAMLSSPLLEVSRLYHDIRGQAHVRLYVIFGILEVTDKLLSSIAQEVFTVLVGLPLTNLTTKSFAKLVFFSLGALIFFVCHSYALIYQSVALHVAANSYSNALLALLLSNQFSELKSAVFKKFEREGLFQVAMSDLTKRFQLSIMLFVIALRNVSQLSSTQLGLIPNSWKSWNSWFGAIFGPTVFVLGSEILVDWVKHCYINKFNLIRPRIYENFLYVLSSDFKEVFSSNSSKNTSHEVSDYVLLTKRIGLPLISLTICFLRMALKDLRRIFVPSGSNTQSILSSFVLIVLCFVVLLVTRLLLSLWLLKWAQAIKRDHDAYQQTLYAATSLNADAISHADTVSNADVISHAEFLSGGHEMRGIVTPEDAELQITPEPSIIGLQEHCDAFFEDSLTSTPMKANLCGTGYCENILSPTDSEIEFTFLPGIPNTESSSINPRTRFRLYDAGENVPPTLEEKRNASFVKNRAKSPELKVDSPCDDSLHRVQRYEMASKKIW